MSKFMIEQFEVPESKQEIDVPTLTDAQLKTKEIFGTLRNVTITILEDCNCG